ncbi:MAG: hypothetical protein ACRECP_02730 [Methylocella sp.]
MVNPDRQRWGISAVGQAAGGADVDSAIAEMVRRGILKAREKLIDLSLRNGTLHYRLSETSSRKVPAPRSTPSPLQSTTGEGGAGARRRRPAIHGHSASKSSKKINRAECNLYSPKNKAVAAYGDWQSYINKREGCKIGSIRPSFWTGARRPEKGIARTFWQRSRPFPV